MGIKALIVSIRHQPGLGRAKILFNPGFFTTESNYQGKVTHK